MAGHHLRILIQHLRRSVCPRGDDTLSDAQLLARWVQQRDETAFEALLRRHGPMVLSVCRRLLRHSHDVEDAFQAAACGRRDVTAGGSRRGRCRRRRG